MIVLASAALAIPLLRGPDAPSRAPPDGAVPVEPLTLQAPYLDERAGMLQPCPVGVPDDAPAAYTPAPVDARIQAEDWPGAVAALAAAAPSLGCPPNGPAIWARWEVQRGIVAFELADFQLAASAFSRARLLAPDLAWSPTDPDGGRSDLFAGVHAPPPVELLVYAEGTLDGQPLSPGVATPVRPGVHTLQLGAASWDLDLSGEVARPVLLDPASPELWRATTTDGGRSALSDFFADRYGGPVYVQTAEGTWRVDGEWVPVGVAPPIARGRMVLGGAGLAAATGGVIGLVAVEAVGASLRGRYYDLETPKAKVRAYYQEYQDLAAAVPITSVVMGVGLSTIGAALVVPFDDEFRLFRRRDSGAAPVGQVSP